MENNLSYKDKAKFNALYNKANELMRDKITFEGHKNNLSTMDKIELVEAIALLKECVKIYPDSWQSMWAISLANHMLEENSEALEWFKRAYRINPSIKTMK